jgi:NAD(P)-dependent dehydrogenase (short-subunit alcohol dehydrogenase family)
VIADSLDGKVVVVTGGSRGIGRAIVLAAVARGARVAFCSRTLGAESEDTLAEARATCSADHDVRAIAVAADVSLESHVDRLFDATLEAFGRVDAVVNNAGIEKDDLLVRLSREWWDDVIATNLTGPFLVSRRAVREFLAAGRTGAIVTLGSLSQNGAPSQASYAASKAGLTGLTESIAREYGHQGVRANLLIVGFVETALSAPIPECARRFLVDSSTLKRSAEPSEIATAALFLASDRSSAMNGRTVHASAGLVDIAL